MPAIVLATDNHTAVLAAMDAAEWTVACLCAAWCGTCGSYRASFEQLAARHPDKCFLWIDVEDQADTLGELDIENFPTLLLQKGETVAFLGTMLPDINVADRLIRQAHALKGQPDWQAQANLRQLLRKT